MSAIVFKAPEKVKNPDNWPSVFLAGAIDMGSADDWQAEITETLEDVDCVILNPRRDDWDSSWEQSIDNKKFREQVEWELKGLEDATFVVLCLTKDSKAPISLLELGLHVVGRRMLVFCPEGFYRKGNVDVVCHRYGVPVFDDFEDFSRNVKARMLETIAGTHQEKVLPAGTIQEQKSYYIEASDRVARRMMSRQFITGMRKLRAFQQGDIVTVKMEQVRQEIPSHGGPVWYKKLRRMLGQGWGALKIWEVHGDEAEVTANHPLGIADGTVLVPLRLLRTASKKESDSLLPHLELSQLPQEKKAMKIASELLKAAREVMAMPKMVKVGDKVMWEGGFGMDAPVEARVTGMTLTEGPGEKYGVDVKQAFWSDVKNDRVVFDLDNGHWAYGEQISLAR